ncbi:MAG TPA: Calx-beta domain-containing protein, partial [Pyrinomonadaceae bacterium]|nr:Calx-beta domain-containing protein [Pyrinomonadaceae bacterium]
YMLFGNATIGNATAVNFTGNAANNGGGLYSTWNNLAADAAASITMTTGSIGQSGAANNAKVNGGGIAIDVAGSPTPTSSITLNAVSIQGNNADSDNNGTGSGGGIFGNGGAQVTTNLNATTAIGGATAGQQNTANVGGGIHMASGTLNSSAPITANRAKTNGGGISIAGGTTTLTSVTIRSNIADSDNNNSGDGGGIFRSGGTLTLSGTVTIGGTVTGDGNTAVNGGGVSNTSGAFSMTNGAIRFNKAKNNGGGIQFSGTTLTLNGTSVLNNQANSDSSGGGDGGGIHNSGTTVSITGNATIGSTGNGNSAVNGGGIANTAGTLTYTGTGATGGTIIGNSATTNGGAIAVSGGTANLSVLTITGNSANTGGGGFVSAGALNTSLSRIVGNTATTGSGVSQTGGTALVENNWWGCDGFPNTGGCQTGSGTFDADPRIDLTLAPAAGNITLGGTKVFTADVSRNTLGTVISPVVMNGLSVSFSLTGSPAGGSILPTSATITSFTGATTYTAPTALCGLVTVTAQIDNSPGQSANATITCNSDLAVTKSDSPDPVIVGNNITYTINFVNNGPSNDTNVTVTDATPTNTTFVSAAVTTGSGWSTTTPAVGGTGNVVFSKGDVANGETAVFTIIVKVNNNVANNTSISNTVTAAGDPTDPASANNSDTETTTAVTQADIAMTESDSPDPVTAGLNITYTIGLTNNGPNPAVNASISDPIPANTTFVSVTTPAGWTRTDAVPVGGTGTITFTKASVANAETASCTLVVKANASAPNGSTITNTVSGASTTTDPTPGNNNATTTTTVSTSADLSVTKSDAPDPVNAGSNITYTINFNDSGPSDAQTVTVTDATPANTTFVSAAVTTGTGWSISAPAVGATGNVVFSKATVAAVETAQFSMVVNVNGSTPNATTISNSAVAASTTSDPNSANNTGTAMTTVVGPPELFARDAKKPEPTAGSQSMLFTVVLSPAAAGTVTVHYATADDTLGANPATANVDYTPTSGDLTFNAGQRVKVVAVPILADASSPENNETFLLNLSTPSGALITDGQAIGTITQPPGQGPPGTLTITEIRTSGPAGAGDDFVELYNNTDSTLNVAASDVSAGYGVFKKGADCNANPVLIGTIPNGTIIPGRGHYLLVGSSYSLGGYATGDQTLTADIDSDANVAVFTTTDVANLSSLTVLDAVGFGSNTGGVCDLLSEGTTLPTLSGSVLEHSFQRDPCGKGAVPGSFGPCLSTNPIDSNNNATDFLFVDTTATATPAGQRLGAPAPENLASPFIRNSAIAALLLDATKGQGVTPNRLRDLTVVPNGTLGTLSIRRRFVNNAGAPVTRLRFRVVDITSFPVPGGIADVRALTSPATTASGITDPATCLASTGSATTPCVVTVQGTTVETPVQALGGSLNSTMSAGTITLGTPLANGASINLQLVLGVQAPGAFKFYINIEALP